MASYTQSSSSVVFEKSESQTETTVCMVQTPLLHITLTGPNLVLAILAIIISIQIFHPSLTCTLIALSSISWIIHNDYENFVSLGPGGTPSTFQGYLRITCLRLFALNNPYKPAPCSEQINPKTGYCGGVSGWLPDRKGPRPKVAGIAPQRQIDQPGCPKMYQELRARLETTAKLKPDLVQKGSSCFEKHGLALFAQNPINITCQGEICHVHDSDRSMHLNLHPDDARVVLEKGWGERHPLSRGGWMKAFVPSEFLMVYAPRDRTELEAVCLIIEAAGYWVSGQGIEI
jgi:hypothetical protein